MNTIVSERASIYSNLAHNVERLVPRTGDDVAQAFAYATLVRTSYIPSEFFERILNAFSRQVKKLEGRKGSLPEGLLMAMREGKTAMERQIEDRTQEVIHAGQQQMAARIAGEPL